MRNLSSNPLTLLLGLVTLGTAIWLLNSSPETVAAQPETPLLSTTEPRVTATETPREPETQTAPGQHLVFDVATHTPDELRAVLTQAEALLDGGKTPVDHLVLVLHGADVRYFAHSEYENYKDIVDLAAKLDAHKVIDMKMCRTVMTNAGITDSEIPSFIELVPFGPAEVQRLLAADYLPM